MKLDLWIWLISVILCIISFITFIIIAAVSHGFSMWLDYVASFSSICYMISLVSSRRVYKRQKENKYE